MEPRDAPAGNGDDGDAVDHLWNAAHEMLRAMRMLVDAADEFVESQRAERPAARGAHGHGEGHVHHIDIDWRPDSRAPLDVDADAS